MADIIDFKTKWPRLPILGTPGMLAGFDSKGKPTELDPADLGSGGGGGGTTAFFEGITTITTSTNLTTGQNAYLILVNNSSPVTVRLPSFITEGDRVTLVKISNNSHAVTLSVPVGYKICNEDTYLLEVLNQSAVCVYAYTNNFILI